MKSAVIYTTDYAKQPPIPYPNAATRKELFHKLLDLVLVSAIGVGCAAGLLLMLALT